MRVDFKKKHTSGLTIFCDSSAIIDYKGVRFNFDAGLLRYNTYWKQLESMVEKWRESHNN
jgi:hypothetical protein